MNTAIKQKMSTKELIQAVSEIQQFEKNIKIDRRGCNKFLDLVEKENIPKDIFNNFSNQLNAKVKNISVDNKMAKIKLSQMKDELVKKFENCLIINISTFNANKAANIIDILESQNLILLGKKINNNCYYEFIVKNKLKLNLFPHFEYLTVTSDKVSFKDLTHFVESFDKTEIKQVTGDPKNTQLFQNKHNNDDKIKELEERQLSFNFQLQKAASFSQQVKEQFPFGVNRSGYCFATLTEKEDPINELETIYKNTLTEFKQKIENFKTKQTEFNLDIDFNEEYLKLIEDFSDQLYIEKEKNKTLLEAYLKSSILEEIKQLKHSNEVIEEQLPSYKTLKTSANISEDFKLVLIQNNIFYSEVYKNDLNNETLTLIFVDPETDINDLIGHTKFKHLKGKIH